MSNNLLILAGKTAYAHIREKGLSPADIQVVLGASGAAKWLVLYGLDSALFSRWFQNRRTPLHLFGTSVGAWKFAAATQGNPQEGFNRLKDAYIHQYYKGKVTPTTVSRESERIMTQFLNEKRIDQILSHPFLRMGFAAVRCKGAVASASLPIQALGVCSAYMMNKVGRKYQGLYFDRTFFHDARYDTGVMVMNDFPTARVPLNKENFSQALLASGSIPIIMNGVSRIPGAPGGVYRDGGLLDYHPAFPMAENTNGFILYPHFYPNITPGWFDKNMPGRKAQGPLLDRTILLAPSPAFIADLPFGRIPDRADFSRFAGKDRERVTAWQKAAKMSVRLGDEFLEAAATGSIRDRVQKI